MQKDVHGNQDIYQWEQVPVPMKDRTRTDIVCIFINTAFVVILFIISLSLLNVENLRKMTYPADGEGNLCGYDFPQHPYLYYTSPTDPTKRLCVSKCPQEGDQRLQCSPTPSLSCQANDNPKYQVHIVDTQLVLNRVGIFCMPTDQQQRQNIEYISQVNKKNRFMGFYDAFWSVLWLSVVFGILYVILMYFKAAPATRYIFFLGTVFQFVGAILLLFVPSGWFLGRLVAFFILIALGVMSAFTLFKDQYRQKLLVCAQLNECSVEAFKKNKVSIVYIPIFIALFGLLIVLCCFEILCAWSSAELKFDPPVPFYSVSNFGGAFLTACIFFQFYWGMSFLKEAFNFCVSGYATSWYYYKDKSKIDTFLSFKLLVLKHWGSVLGGSLILGFLYFTDLFIDFISAFLLQRRQNEHNVMKKRSLNAGKQRQFDRQQVAKGSLKESCSSLTNLARSESMAYINLIPIPYCNASRYCEYLEEQSCFYDRSQITNRLFRLGSHIFLIGICAMIAILSNKVSSEKMDIAGVLVILIISMFTVTYFICFFTDISEGILLSVFLEEHLKNQYESLSQAPQSVEKLYQKEKDGEFDRNNTFKEFMWPTKND